MRDQARPRIEAVNMSADFDEHMMRRAVALARRGDGRVEPNPMVGCVIVSGGRVIGEGFHRRFGGPHAEVEALRRCGRSPRAATVYVTLEPCCHVGKTPPCTEALIAARVRKVVVAVRDPNPLVAGRGLRRLRAVGIEAETGVLRDEAAEVLAPYLTRTLLHRPYVIAKWAQSLDGQLVTRSGESKWISGEASRREVHRLRARVDGILVGSGTVLADDPQLTARGVRMRRRATRVILDGRLRIQETSRVVRSARIQSTVVFTAASQAKGRKAQRLRRAGVDVVPVPLVRGRLALDRVLNELADRRVTNLLVEGGPTILSAFFGAGRVDEAWVFTAPRFLGRPVSPSKAPSVGVIDSGRSRVPYRVTVQQIDPDSLYRMRFTRPPMR